MISAAGLLMSDSHLRVIVSPALALLCPEMVTFLGATRKKKDKRGSQSGDQSWWVADTIFTLGGDRLASFSVVMSHDCTFLGQLKKNNTSTMEADTTKYSSNFFHSFASADQKQLPQGVV